MYFNINNIDIINAIISATEIALHIPSIPNISGSISTDNNSNTNDLINAINADIGPLLRAVKKEDVNILIPLSINASVKI